ncbi:MAG TPA: hypothetical protein VMG63_21410 [Terriglobia bacterium]|nr:hypothetical protein [Terriglobia bacterium]
MKIQRYGWVRDLPDHRDFMYSVPVATLQALPSSVATGTLYIKSRWSGRSRFYV